MALDIRWLQNVYTSTCKRSVFCYLSSESLEIYTPSTVRCYQHLTAGTGRHRPRCTYLYWHMFASNWQILFSL